VGKGKVCRVEDGSGLAVYKIVHMVAQVGTHGVGTQVTRPPKEGEWLDSIRGS